MTEIPSWGAVAVSGLLVVVAVAIASWQRLGISREIVVAALRALVQLVAIGAVLAWLFASVSLLIAATVFIPIIVTSLETGQ